MYEKIISLYKNEIQDVKKIQENNILKGCHFLSISTQLDTGKIVLHTFLMFL